MGMDIIKSKKQIINEKLKLQNKLLMVGPCISKGSLFSGQAMMFQLIVDNLKYREYNFTVVDISGNSFNSKQRTGVFTWHRFFEYLSILPKIWLKLFRGDKVVYITTAQSKFGFMRDMLIILPAYALKNKIIAHQFGANYSNFYNEQSSILKSMIRFTLEKASKIIVEGDLVKEQLNFLNNYDEKVFPIPNGLPEKIDSKNIKTKVYSKDETFRIIYLSNMIETKGFWDLLEAVRILVNDKGKNVHCIFAGRFIISPDSKKYSSTEIAKEAFFRYIKNHNIEKNVDYYEGLFNDNKKEAFLKSHVFILPSNYINEGQPVSVLEAMAYGLPVIATEYRLIPSMVINKENGFFVNYGRPDEIVKYVEILMDDIELYSAMSKKTINLYEMNFTPEKYINKLENVISSIH